MLYYRSTGISTWRARGDLGLSLYTDTARPSACGVKAVTQRNGSDAFSFLRCWRKKHDPFLQKKKTKAITGDPPSASALAHAIEQPGAGAADAVAMDPSPSPSTAAPQAPPVVEWPEGGALTQDWVAGLASTLDWCSRHLPADRLPAVLPPALVQRLVLAAAAILHREPNLVRVDPRPGQSVVVVGDVHGQLPRSSSSSSTGITSTAAHGSSRPSSCSSLGRFDSADSTRF